MFSQVGIPELLIVLFVVLLLFGAKRLPGLGRQLGVGLREFKDAVTGEKSRDDAEARPTLDPPPADAPAHAEETAAAEPASKRRG
jgi:sec-independent protein translocase protein TatA